MVREGTWAIKAQPELIPKVNVYVPDSRKKLTVKKKLTESISCLVELKSGAPLRSKPDHFTLNFQKEEDVIEFNKAGVSKER